MFPGAVCAAIATLLGLSTALLLLLLLVSPLLFWLRKRTAISAAELKTVRTPRHARATSARTHTQARSLTHTAQRHRRSLLRITAQVDLWCMRYRPGLRHEAVQEVFAAHNGTGGVCGTQRHRRGSQSLTRTDNARARTHLHGHARARAIRALHLAVDAKRHISICGSPYSAGISHANCSTLR